MDPRDYKRNNPATINLPIIRDIKVKIDSFFVETRLHACKVYGCENNNSGAKGSLNENLAHCQLKKISINADGVCDRMKLRPDCGVGGK